MCVDGLSEQVARGGGVDARNPIAVVKRWRRKRRIRSGDFGTRRANPSSAETLARAETYLRGKAKRDDLGFWQLSRAWCECSLQYITELSDAYSLRVTARTYLQLYSCRSRRCFASS